MDLGKGGKKMKHWKLSMMLLLTLSLISFSAADVTFTSIQEFQAAAGADHQVTFADFNGDGHDDMLARYTDTTAVTPGLAIGVWLYDITNAKFDDTLSTKIRLDEPAGLAAIQTLGSTAGVEQQVKFGDVDGDGDLDMVAVIAATVEIRLNIDGAFQDVADAVIELAGDVAPLWIGVDDFNADTYDDVAIMSHYPGDRPPKVVYGAASLSASITTADLDCTVPDDGYVAGAGYTSVVTGDFNDDTYADFAYSTIDAAGAGGRTVIHFGGLAMDADPDLVMSLAMNAVAISDSTSAYLRWPSQMFSTGDFNGDGVDDIFTSAYLSYSSHVLPNAETGVNETIVNNGTGLIYLGGTDIDDIPDAYIVPSDRWLAHQSTPTGSYSYQGYRTYSLGDMNGDGTDEFSFPSQYWDLNLIYAGNDTLVQATSWATSVLIREEMSFYSKAGRYDIGGYIDQHGSVLVPVGDVNGDGFEDVATTTNYYGSASDAASVNVIFGSAIPADSLVADKTFPGYLRVAGSDIDLDADGFSEFVASDASYLINVIEETEFANSDMTWFGAGDFNDDTIADVAVMSIYPQNGVPLVVYGSATPAADISVADVVCTFADAETYAFYPGYTSVIVGDYNGDSVDDFAFGDNDGLVDGGRTTVYFGGADFDGTPGAVLNLAGSSAPFSLGDSESIILRWASAMFDQGDFNGDGYTDIFTGAWYSYTNIVLWSPTSEQDEVMYHTGAGLIYLGGPAFDDIADVVMVPPNDFIKYTELATSNFVYSGYQVHNAGDVDGDGTDDVSLPAWYWDLGMIYTGDASYTQAASAADAVLLRDPALHFSKNRWNTGWNLDQHGAVLTTLGDVDGDGLADLGNTRDYYGTGPDDDGIRLFLSSAYRDDGKLRPDTETPAYTHLQYRGARDFNGDTQPDMVVTNAAGNLEIVSISVVGPVVGNTAPEPVVHNAPAADAALAGFLVDFAWERAVDADGDVAVYTLNLTIGDLDSSISVGTDTSYTFDGTGIMEYDVAYSWTVTADDLWDMTTSTPTSFSIATPNSPPGDFTLLSPADGDTTRTDNIELSWNPSIDPDGDAILYAVHVRNDVEDTTFTDLSETTLNIDEGTFEAFQSLTWSVVASDGLAEGYSDTATFYYEGTTGIAGELAIPEEYVLQQNYPNPFNPSTTIRYGLPEATDVLIIVYDSRGRMVAQLENSYRAAGWYTLEWHGNAIDGRAMSTGIYFARINAGSFTQVIKMLYLK
jgi:hypothetical protein